MAALNLLFAALRVVIAISFLVMAWLTGYEFLKRFLPGVFKVTEGESFFGKPIPLKKWMVTVPAAFITGTILVTWATYIIAYAFKKAGNPILYGNIGSFLLFGGIIIYQAVIKKSYAQAFSTIKGMSLANFKNFWRENRVELVFVLAAMLVWSFYMFLSFSAKGNMLYVGSSVFSDFGPHIAMIRSFSQGSNFPTSYPHFPDGTIRYHFLFLFLVGNLEFLGMRIDWALNLPSILAFTAFMMMLFNLAVIIMGNKWTGVITGVLFFFRSSFAFFTYIFSISPGRDFLTWIGNVVMAILVNKDHIGKSSYQEGWGLWAQKTYVNQRHFPFSLSLMILIIILLLPLLQKMIRSLLEARKSPAPFKTWWKEYIATWDAWEPEDFGRSIVIGILLGLTGFWHGSVVVGTLSILFILALFSKHRMEFINIAFITVALVMAESSFFMGSTGPLSNSNLITIGFLAEQKTFLGILSYYLVLLGIFPFVLLVEWFFAPRGVLWLSLAFMAPWVVANTLQLTPDITVNHKFVMMSVLLLNIMAADFICRGISGTLERRRMKIRRKHIEETVPEEGQDHVPGLQKEVAVAEESVYAPFHKVVWKAVAILVIFLMTITGVVDAITLYNMDRFKYGQDVMTNPLKLWVEKNTEPDDIFLTHIHVMHPILFAGRKIYYGWPYFAWSAGYDTGKRESIVNEIYAGQNPARIKDLLITNKIRYIVIEDANRTSQYYVLNEQFFRDNFPLVYEDTAQRIFIYQVY